MSLPLFTQDMTNVSVGAKLVLPITAQTAGIGHSNHPQYFKSPAHILCRNLSSSVMQVDTDAISYPEYVGASSTIVTPIPPSCNIVTYTVVQTVSTNGSATGQSNLCIWIYYFPGEPLPHPMGR